MVDQDQLQLSSLWPKNTIQTMHDPYLHTEHPIKFARSVTIVRPSYAIRTLNSHRVALYPAAAGADQSLTNRIVKIQDPEYRKMVR